MGCYVYETEDVLAFLTINPISDGHTLVIPKAHYRDMFHIPLSVLEKIMPVAKKIAKIAKKALEADGVNMLQSSGSAAQQDVFHFHVHIIPRYEGDQIHFSPGRQGDKEKIDVVAEKMRRQF